MDDSALGKKHAETVAAKNLAIETVMEKDPVRASTVSAVWLAEDIESLLRIAEIHHPEGKYTTGDNEEYRIRACDVVIYYGDQLRQGLDRHLEILKLDVVWEPLCKANDRAASFWGYHAPCFSAAIKDIAKTILGDLLCVSGLEDEFTFSPFSVSEMNSSKLTEDIDVALRLLTRVGRTPAPEHFDFRLIELELWKEYQRATGKLPERDDFTPRKRITRPGSQAHEVMQLHGQGRTIDQICQTLQLEPKRVNEILKNCELAS